MKNLKSLVSLRPKASPITGESSSPGEQTVGQITITDSGYEESKKSNGNPHVLAEHLEHVYQGFREKCRKDEHYQRKLKEPYLVEQEKQKTELLKRNTAKEIKENEVSQLRDRTARIDAEIADVKANPEKYIVDADKKPKAKFYMGLIVLLPITIYLLVFYISASYSAFFKDFSTSKLSAAIFDAQAFSSALNDGWLEAVFVSTIPFTFMGLGYLVHMFQHEGRKGIFKIIGLYIVTFVFDSILAYQIENKIYDFNRTLDSKDFNLSIAFTEVRFWGIIFAGFVVYIIWGLVFDFVMKEYENLDRINAFIKVKKDEKNTIEKSIRGIEEQVNQIRGEIAQITGKISELQSTIDSFLFTNRDYRLHHQSFLVGWLRAIMELHLPKEERDLLTEQCREESRKHLKSIGINETEDETNIINLAS